MEGVKSASLIIAYNVGSRIEPAPIAGAAHFLEHMLFKGTTNRPDPLTISQEIESVGGILNAGTGRENTSYWAKVPGMHLALAFEVLADMLRNSVFDPDELEKERKVIFEEIRAVQDIPEDMVHDVIDQLVWGDDPVGRDVAGSEETVANIDREAMVDFFHRNYGADRLVVAAGGDVNHEEVVALTERFFGDLPVTINPHTSTVASSDQTEKRIKLITRDTEQAHLCLGFPALSYYDDRRYVQSTIEAILSSGMSSRLFQEIREKRGLVYSVYGYFRSHEDIGQGVIYAGTDTERVKETIEAIMVELKKLRDEPVPEDELERTKTLRKGRLLMGLEDSRSVASWVGSQEATYGFIETPEEMMVHIDAVTSAQVQELANDLLQEQLMNLVLIGPYAREREYLPLITLD
ncbi:MAG: insulinase family protein [Thermomicrobiales bacterium]|nr:insulinase family protein [Thermomicrobiales bacterium]